MPKLRVSHADGADAQPEIELDFELEGDLGTADWRARSSGEAPSPVDGSVFGPVVVTVLDGANQGSRADAQAEASAEGVISLAGETPFVQVL
jgi:hypothetical protein